MRLITLALTLAKIDVTRGSAIRTASGVLVSTSSGNSLQLPIQTVQAVVDDEMTRDAVVKMTIGTNVPMSVFHLACKRIVDEYYTPGKKQQVMDTRLVVHDKKLSSTAAYINTLKADRIIKRRTYEALHRPNGNG